MSVLDAVMNPPTEEPTGAPPVETGKLQAGNVLINVAAIGDALRRMAEAYQKIPTSTLLGLDICLEDMIKDARHIITKAERLIKANK